MNMNTTVRGGLIRLVAGPVAAFAIVGAAVGLSAVTHASTAADSGPRTSVSVEHGAGGAGRPGHGVVPKSDGSSAAVEQGDGTATAHGSA
jgi:hypothetical protein